MRWLKHRLQWGDFVIELQRLAAPQPADLVDRFRDAGDRIVIRDRHLGKPQRQAASQGERDAARREVVEGRHRHRHDHRVASVGVEGARAQSDAARFHCHRAQVGDRIPLEVAVVDPDGVEPKVLGAARPSRDVAHVAPGGQPDTDPAAQLCHEITVLQSRTGRNRDPA